MREILPTLENWLAQGEEIALATLVDTHGASPRPAGARLCLTRSGQMEGSVSGGCVESDVFTRALQVLDTSHPALVRYSIETETSVAVGLSCGGEIDVLIEPFRKDQAWDALASAIQQQSPAVLCTGLGPESILGKRMTILKSGHTQGDIAPEIDAQLIDRGLSLLPLGGQTLFESDASETSVRVLIEAFPQKPRLYIIGATHIATALCPMAVMLGFHVSVIDPRTPFATPERFPKTDELVLEWPHEALAKESLDESAFVLTLTHDMKFDIPTLAHALRSKARYIGALGSRRTHERRLTRLREEGFNDTDFQRIHTPIGLALGGRSPEEIALSILAELVASRNQPMGAPLGKIPILKSKQANEL